MRDHKKKKKEKVKKNVIELFREAAPQTMRSVHSTEFNGFSGAESDYRTNVFLPYFTNMRIREAILMILGPLSP